MKTFLTLTLLVASAAALSACQATARDRDGYVSVGTHDGYYKRDRDDGYYHCPPGHAKKGWC